MRGARAQTDVKPKRAQTGSNGLKQPFEEWEAAWGLNGSNRTVCSPERAGSLNGSKVPPLSLISLGGDYGPERADTHPPSLACSMYVVCIVYLDGRVRPECRRDVVA